MEYLYEKLHKTEYVQDAFVRWRDYRTDLTQYVSECLTKPSKIAILGAGACNDYDLLALALQGHEVTLVDYDEAAMKVGLVRQHMEHKIKTVVMDFFPITASGYHELEELFCRNAPFHEVKAYLRLVLEQALNNDWHLPERYDMVLAVGLHSQLAITLITLLQEYQRIGQICFSKEELCEYQSYVATINKWIVEEIHTKICASTSCLLYGYEYGSFFNGDDTIYQVKALFEQGKAELVKQLGISRIQGACQLEQLIAREIYGGRLSIDKICYFVWPFLEEKQYLMVAYVCRRVLP